MGSTPGGLCCWVSSFVMAATHMHTSNLLCTVQCGWDVGQQRGHALLWLFVLAGLLVMVC